MASSIMRAPVRERTGRGKLEYALYYSPSLLSSDGDLAAFPVALQEQLGLKLAGARGLVDVVVIDSVEEPSEN